MATLDDLEQRIAALEAMVAHQGPAMEHTEPFDSPMVLTRNESTDWGNWHTSTIFALIHEAHARWSCAMPFYVEGWATDHPEADQGALTAMDTAMTVRGYAPGVGWQAALQVENYHMKSGTSIALGIEMARTSAEGTNIAVNILSDPERSPAGPSDIAINVENAAGAGFKEIINVAEPGAIITVAGRPVLSVEGDGSIVIGGDAAHIIVRPDGNVGINCGRLWFNDKPWR